MHRLHTYTHTHTCKYAYTHSVVKWTWPLFNPAVDHPSNYQWETVRPEDTRSLGT